MFAPRKIQQWLDKTDIHFDTHWGLFIGQLNGGLLHKHYLLQITVVIKDTFDITNAYGKQQAFEGCFINSDVIHQLNSNDLHLTIWVDPVRARRYTWLDAYQSEQIVALQPSLVKNLQQIFTAYRTRKTDRTTFLAALQTCLFDNADRGEQINPYEDDRIYKAIQHLEQHVDRVVSLREIAAFCFLSESRFLHLFKEKTNLNFRRYQLWNKLLKSLPYLQQHTITDTACTFGFTDSAHYSRTFKENFGVSPKILFRLK
ncbi:helix-turn-helix domain-containing protein [Chitinophaga nivalis]|uniref:AraC family transcriptional regulator n=1 Tax=Chitinophaga nivalis TaxID=2991709 RepID=A0ABT3IME3_9BACT|nr:AraC family transcriptional regulator [Chitinophaga nivalis]MCW3465195.1 AraC family transcriptional regulator [Chitinophaga nivalis]MCW3485113.1 AraC family transcriptional regulator [Chitinophaga nivalis]